jgi:hypothetical protein
VIKRSVCLTHGIVWYFDYNTFQLGEYPQPFEFCPRCGEKCEIVIIDISTIGSTYTYQNPPSYTDVKPTKISGE